MANLAKMSEQEVKFFIFVHFAGKAMNLENFLQFQITQQLKEIANNVVNGDLSERAALFQSITGIVEGEGKIFLVFLQF